MPNHILDFKHSYPIRFWILLLLVLLSFFAFTYLLKVVRSNYKLHRKLKSTKKIKKKG